MQRHHQRGIERPAGDGVAELLCEWLVQQGKGPEELPGRLGRGHLSFCLTFEVIGDARYNHAPFEQ